MAQSIDPAVTSGGGEMRSRAPTPGISISQDVQQEAMFKGIEGKARELREADIEAERMLKGSKATGKSEVVGEGPKEEVEKLKESLATMTKRGDRTSSILKSVSVGSAVENLNKYFFETETAVAKRQYEGAVAQANREYNMAMQSYHKMLQQASGGLGDGTGAQAKPVPLTPEQQAQMDRWNAEPVYDEKTGKWSGGGLAYERNRDGSYTQVHEKAETWEDFLRITQTAKAENAVHQLGIAEAQDKSLAQKRPDADLTPQYTEAAKAKVKEYAAGVYEKYYGLPQQFAAQREAKIGEAGSKLASRLEEIGSTYGAGGSGPLHLIERSQEGGSAPGGESEPSKPITPEWKPAEYSAQQMADINARFEVLQARHRAYQQSRVLNQLMNKREITSNDIDAIEGMNKNLRMNLDKSLYTDTERQHLDAFTRLIDEGVKAYRDAEKTTEAPKTKAATVAGSLTITVGDRAIQGAQITPPGSMLLPENLVRGTETLTRLVQPGAPTAAPDGVSRHVASNAASRVASTKGTPTGSIFDLSKIGIVGVASAKTDIVFDKEGGWVERGDKGQIIASGSPGSREPPSAPSVVVKPDVASEAAKAVFSGSAGGKTYDEYRQVDTTKVYIPSGRYSQQSYSDSRLDNWQKYSPTETREAFDAMIRYHQDKGKLMDPKLVDHYLAIAAQALPENQFNEVKKGLTEKVQGLPGMDKYFTGKEVFGSPELQSQALLKIAEDARAAGIPLTKSQSEQFDRIIASFDQRKVFTPPPSTPKYTSPISGKDMSDKEIYDAYKGHYVPDVYIPKGAYSQMGHGDSRVDNWMIYSNQERYEGFMNLADTYDKNKMKMAPELRDHYLGMAAKALRPDQFKEFFQKTENLQSAPGMDKYFGSDRQAVAGSVQRSAVALHGMMYDADRDVGKLTQSQREQFKSMIGDLSVRGLPSSDIAKLSEQLDATGTGKTTPAGVVPLSKLRDVISQIGQPIIPSDSAMPTTTGSTTAARTGESDKAALVGVGIGAGASPSVLDALRYLPKPTSQQGALENPPQWTVGEAEGAQSTALLAALNLGMNAGKPLGKDFINSMFQTIDNFQTVSPKDKMNMKNYISSYEQYATITGDIDARIDEAQSGGKELTADDVVNLLTQAERLYALDSGIASNRVQLINDVVRTQEANKILKDLALNGSKYQGWEWNEATTKVQTIASGIQNPDLRATVTSLPKEFRTINLANDMINNVYASQISSSGDRYQVHIGEDGKVTVTEEIYMPPENFNKWVDRELKNIDVDTRNALKMEYKTAVDTARLTHDIEVVKSKGGYITDDDIAGIQERMKQTPMYSNKYIDSEGFERHGFTEVTESLNEARATGFNEQKYREGLKGVVIPGTLGYVLPFIPKEGVKVGEAILGAEDYGKAAVQSAEAKDRYLQATGQSNILASLGAWWVKQGGMALRAPGTFSREFHQGFTGQRVSDRPTVVDLSEVAPAYISVYGEGGWGREGVGKHVSGVSVHEMSEQAAEVGGAVGAATPFGSAGAGFGETIGGGAAGMLSIPQQAAVVGSLPVFAGPGGALEITAAAMGQMAGGMSRTGKDDPFRLGGQIAAMWAMHKVGTRYGKGAELYTLERKLPSIRAAGERGKIIEATKRIGELRDEGVKPIKPITSRIGDIKIPTRSGEVRTVGGEVSRGIGRVVEGGIVRAAGVKEHVFAAARGQGELYTRMVDLSRSMQKLRPSELAKDAGVEERYIISTDAAETAGEHVYVGRQAEVPKSAVDAIRTGQEARAIDIIQQSVPDIPLRQTVVVGVPERGAPAYIRNVMDAIEGLRGRGRSPGPDQPLEAPRSTGVILDEAVKKATTDTKTTLTRVEEPPVLTSGTQVKLLATEMERLLTDPGVTTTEQFKSKLSLAEFKVDAGATPEEIHALVRKFQEADPDSHVTIAEKINEVGGKEPTKYIRVEKVLEDPTAYAKEQANIERVKSILDTLNNEAKAGAKYDELVKKGVDIKKALEDDAKYKNDMVKYYEDLQKYEEAKQYLIEKSGPDADLSGLKVPEKPAPPTVDISEIRPYVDGAGNFKGNKSVLEFVDKNVERTAYGGRETSVYEVTGDREFSSIDSIIKGLKLDKDIAKAYDFVIENRYDPAWGDSPKTFLRLLRKGGPTTEQKLTMTKAKDVKPKKSDITAETGKGKAKVGTKVEGEIQGAPTYTAGETSLIQKVAGTHAIEHVIKNLEREYRSTDSFTSKEIDWIDGKMMGRGKKTTMRAFEVPEDTIDAVVRQLHEADKHGEFEIFRLGDKVFIAERHTSGVQEMFDALTKDKLRRKTEQVPEGERTAVVMDGKKLNLDELKKFQDRLSSEEGLSDKYTLLINELGEGLLEVNLLKRSDIFTPESVLREIVREFDPVQGGVETSTSGWGNTFFMQIRSKMAPAGLKNMIRERVDAAARAAGKDPNLFHIDVKEVKGIVREVDMQQMTPAERGRMRRLQSNLEDAKRFKDSNVAAEREKYQKAKAAYDDFISRLPEKTDYVTGADRVEVLVTEAALNPEKLAGEIRGTRGYTQKVVNEDGSVSHHIVFPDEAPSMSEINSIMSNFKRTVGDSGLYEIEYSAAGKDGSVGSISIIDNTNKRVRPATRPVGVYTLTDDVVGLIEKYTGKKWAKSGTDAAAAIPQGSRAYGIFHNIFRRGKTIHGHDVTRTEMTIDTLGELFNLRHVSDAYKNAVSAAKRSAKGTEFELPPEKAGYQSVIKKVTAKKNRLLRELEVLEREVQDAEADIEAMDRTRQHTGFGTKEHYDYQQRWQDLAELNRQLNQKNKDVLKYTELLDNLKAADDLRVAASQQTLRAHYALGEQILTFDKIVKHLETKEKGAKSALDALKSTVGKKDGTSRSDVKKLKMEHKKIVDLKKQYTKGLAKTKTMKEFLETDPMQYSKLLDMGKIDASGALSPEYKAVYYDRLIQELGGRSMEEVFKPAEKAKNPVVEEYFRREQALENARRYADSPDPAKRATYTKAYKEYFDYVKEYHKGKYSPEELAAEKAWREFKNEKKAAYEKERTNAEIELRASDEYDNMVKLQKYKNSRNFSEREMYTKAKEAYDKLHKRAMDDVDIKVQRAYGELEKKRMASWNEAADARSKELAKKAAERTKADKAAREAEKDADAEKQKAAEKQKEEKKKSKNAYQERLLETMKYKDSPDPVERQQYQHAKSDYERNTESRRASEQRRAEDEAARLAEERRQANIKGAEIDKAAAELRRQRLAEKEVADTLASLEYKPDVPRIEYVPETLAQRRATKMQSDDLYARTWEQEEWSGKTAAELMGQQQKQPQQKQPTAPAPRKSRPSAGVGGYGIEGDAVLRRAESEAADSLRRFGEAQETGTETRAALKQETRQPQIRMEENIERLRRLTPEERILPAIGKETPLDLGIKIGPKMAQAYLPFQMHRRDSVQPPAVTQPVRIMQAETQAQVRANLWDIGQKQYLEEIQLIGQIQPQITGQGQEQGQVQGQIIEQQQELKQEVRPVETTMQTPYIRPPTLTIPKIPLLPGLPGGGGGGGGAGGRDSTRRREIHHPIISAQQAMRGMFDIKFKTTFGTMKKAANVGMSRETIARAGTGAGGISRSAGVVNIGSKNIVKTGFIGGGKGVSSNIGNMINSISGKKKKAPASSMRGKKKQKKQKK